MSRVRIRSLKPEMWADERVGRLSREARLLCVCLITMADDEGRLRALPAAILGHAYLYDTDAPKLLPRWIAELTESGIVIGYEHDGFPYLAFKHWRRHQRINRPTASAIPAPPNHEVVTANSVKSMDEMEAMAA
jgi:hypothetical protein